MRPTEHYRETVIACYDYCWWMDSQTTSPITDIHPHLSYSLASHPPSSSSCHIIILASHPSATSQSQSSLHFMFKKWPISISGHPEFLITRQLSHLLYRLIQLTIDSNSNGGETKRFCWYCTFNLSKQITIFLCKI